MWATSEQNTSVFPDTSLCSDTYPAFVASYSARPRCFSNLCRSSILLSLLRNTLGQAIICSIDISIVSRRKSSRLFRLVLATIKMLNNLKSQMFKICRTDIKNILRTKFLLFQLSEDMENVLENTKVLQITFAVVIFSTEI